MSKHIIGLAMTVFVVAIAGTYAAETLTSVEPEDLAAAAASYLMCPVPACHAPCNPAAPPDVQCKFAGGGERSTSYACCCCGGTGNSYRPLATGGASWVEYGFAGNHASFNSAEKLLTRTNVGSLVPVGAVDIGTGPATSPIVAKGVAYVAVDGSIAAIDVRRRATLWSSLSCTGSQAAEPAYANGRVFAGDLGGDLAAYDAITGALLWCRDAGGSIQSAPTVDGNMIYVSNHGDLIAVEQATGTARWRFTVTETPGPSSSPAVGNAVFVTGPGTVYAVRKSDGRLIWKRDLGAPYELSAPAVSGDTVYVGADGLYALNAGDGRVRWVSHVAGVNVSMPAIAGGRLFVNSEDPAFGLFALDKNGALLWRSTVAGESRSTASVANGVVYDISESGALLEFDAASGALLGSQADPEGRPFESQIGAQAVVVNGAVYVVTGDPTAANAMDVFAMAPPPQPLMLEEEDTEP